MDGLAMHPTVKPVGLVADAIKDCSRRGEVVLDPFAGSGTTLIAAEKCGRQLHRPSANAVEFLDHTGSARQLRRPALDLDFSKDAPS
jgi:DNA methylase